jgi:hypothetical protein
MISCRLGPRRLSPSSVVWQVRHALLNINCPDAASAVLCVAEQELDGPKIAGAPIDQRRLRSSEGMGAEKLRFKSDSSNPFRDK